jgi:hypothetical protein
MSTSKQYSAPTWADLLKALQSLTPEQLARPAQAGDETHSYNEVRLMVTTEAHYEVDPHEPWMGEAEALAEIGPEELAKCDKEEAGAVYLLLD